jgi:ankyrin repeat protein
MKKAVTTILIVFILTLTGCGKQENRFPHVSLHIAALQGNIDEIHSHIQAGSDLNEKDEYGSTPLIVAITFGKTEVANALIEAGADITITNKEGSTPLHIAAFLCRTEIVEALLAHGADKSIKNNSGHTSLDSVAVPFENVKSTYDQLKEGLGPLGFRLDYEWIKETRPKIAEMLQ